MYPAGTVEVGKALRPGDEITAKVPRGGTTYTLALTDATHPANGFSVTQNCTALQGHQRRVDLRAAAYPMTASCRSPATALEAAATRPRRPAATPGVSPASRRLQDH